jgi:DNA-binding winged helix-turn-helix (wHTH) protein
MVFDPFHLDPVQRVLTRNGEPVALPPQIFDLLLYFLENPDRILTKNELLQAIWPDRIVTEGSLTQAVFTLRKALQDGGGTDRSIVTSPGRGYRFVGVVRVEDEEPSDAAASDLQQPDLNRDLERSPDARPTIARLGRGAGIAVLSGFAVLVLAGGAWLSLERTRPPDPAVEAAPLPANAIAVLPFANLSGDPKQDYFSDGVADEIRSELARLGGLTARTEATVKFLGVWSMMIPPEERDGWWFELRNLAEAHARGGLD